MNRKAKLFSALFLALMLRPEIAAAQNVSPALAKLIEARDDQRCQKLGALPGTEAYITCRLKLQEMAQQQWAAQNSAMQQLLSSEAAQNQFLAPPRARITPLPMPTAPRRPTTTNCTSDAIGDTVYTNCQEQ